MDSKELGTEMGSTEMHLLQTEIFSDQSSGYGHFLQVFVLRIGFRRDRVDVTELA